MALIKKISFLLEGLFPKFELILNPFKRIEFDEIVKNLHFSNNDEILDFGCGYGYQTILLAKQKCKKIVGIDPSEEAILHAHKLLAYKNSKKVIFRKGLIEKINFRKNQFDKVVSFCVIEHIQDYPEILKEIYRILKPSGEFVISVDSLQTIQDAKLLDIHSKKYFVKHYFQNDELTTVLRQIGFQNVHVYAIFKSDFARKLFIKIMLSNTRINPIISLLNYLRLKMNEIQNSSNKKGIFLIAYCTK